MNGNTIIGLVESKKWSLCKCKFNVNCQQSIWLELFLFTVV